eukprot:m.207926 g.207926  ORF g.207926 m.207926 type:complete len:50 (-) comp17125_c0_seq2:2797-2946(-)
MSIASSPSVTFRGRAKSCPAVPDTKSHLSQATVLLSSISDFRRQMNATH